MRHALKYSAATEDDIPKLFNAAHTLIDNVYSPYDPNKKKALDEVYRRMCGNISQYTAVSVKKCRVAYFHLYTEDNVTWLEDLYVLESFRCLGIGSMIIEHCISISADEVFVKLSEQDYASGVFYINKGFLPVENHDGYYIHRFVAE